MLVLNALGRGQELTPAYFHLNFRFSFCKIRVIRNSWESSEGVRGISDAGPGTNHRRLFFVGPQSGCARCDGGVGLLDHHRGETYGPISAN